jgi:hypothetical protein
MGTTSLTIKRYTKEIMTISPNKRATIDHPGLYSSGIVGMRCVTKLKSGRHDGQRIRGRWKLEREFVML